MSDEQEPKKVYCIRNRLMKDASEHVGCPYCFGKKREAVEGGERKDFCDFDPLRIRNRCEIVFNGKELSSLALKSNVGGMPVVGAVVKMAN